MNPYTATKTKEVVDAMLLEMREAKPAFDAFQLHELLNDAFTWSNTEESTEYWADVSMKLKRIGLEGR